MEFYPLIIVSLPPPLPQYRILLIVSHFTFRICFGVGREMEGKGLGRKGEKGKEEGKGNRLPACLNVENIPMWENFKK